MASESNSDISESLSSTKETTKESLETQIEDTDDEDELEKDIAGLSLANPYFFFDRMYRRDPALFLTKKEGKFNAYSRICPSNVKRQPVILTDKEKER